ncbi:MAG: GIY-YIG nuclease family protein [Methylocella sp.]
MTQGATIYILHCKDGSYYTGITRRSVEERVSEHAQGLIKGCYTESRLPVELVFSEHYERADEAIAAERRIKGWSRAKKEAMMRGDFAALSVLAKRKIKPRKQASDPSYFETAYSRPPHDEGS